MYGLNLSGLVPPPRVLAQPTAKQTAYKYGDHYCEGCMVRWLKEESSVCWSCGTDMEPEEKDESNADSPGN
jgi:rRNA maturation endonuclease Nob1